jgi:hypothetical protein
MPSALRRQLPGHFVRTVQAMGWSGAKNGALLTLMQQMGFDILLTGDRSLRHQQNLGTFGVAVVVMRAKSNKLDDLIPLIPFVETALSSILPGDAVEL